MIARLIDWSARNLMLVFIGTVFAVAAGVYALQHSAARCHSRSLRHPGDRLHRIQGPGAAGHRGPGHLSADDGDADGAEIESGARLFVLRRLVRLHHLRGRHRHLLGALARARISQRRRAQTARRRDADAWGPMRPASAGSINTRCSPRTCRWPICARCRTGTSATASPRRKAWPRSPASAASSSNTTSSSIRIGCARSTFRCRRCATSSAAATWTSAAAPSNSRNSNSSCAGAAISRASPTCRTSC